jgi:hypothetical protein
MYINTKAINIIIITEPDLFLLVWEAECNTGFSDILHIPHDQRKIANKHDNKV